MDTVLELFKIDLGITHDKRDDYFRALLSAAQKELESKGITLHLETVEDQVLLSDYGAWVYRKRQENVPLAKNLQWRIRNRAVAARTGVEHVQKEK